MYFIDVQGTIIDDINKAPIDGAVDFINTLNDKKIPYLIITNNTKKSSNNFLTYLNSIGFNIKKERYLDPLMIIKQQLTTKKIAPYGHDEFITTLKDMRYDIDYNNAEAVVVGIKKDFMPNEYANMIELLLNGAKLFGMHQSTIYANNHKRYPGVGAILEMLKFATGTNYNILGKPSINFYKKAQELINISDFNDITIISDDVVGDLVGAKKLGMKTVFVLSGKYKNTNEILPKIDKKLQPDQILNSISEMVL